MCIHNFLFPEKFKEATLLFLVSVFLLLLVALCMIIMLNTICIHFAIYFTLLLKALLLTNELMSDVTVLIT